MDLLIYYVDLWHAQIFDHIGSLTYAAGKRGRVFTSIPIPYLAAGIPKEIRENGGLGLDDRVVRVGDLRRVTQKFIDRGIARFLIHNHTTRFWRIPETRVRFWLINHLLYVLPAINGAACLAASVRG